MKIKIIFFTIVLILVLPYFVFSQNNQFNNDSLLTEILKSDDSLLNEVLSNQSKYQFQLMYTKVLKDKNGYQLEKHSLNENKYYFNPASLIKLPLLIIALEKMSSLREYGVDLDSRILMHTCSCDEDTDGYIAQSKNPTFRQLMRELMIMSDNDAYNFLYDFVGYDYFNKRYRELGFDGFLMKRRFTSNCSDALNKWYGGIAFLNSENEIIYQQDCDTAKQNYAIDSVKYLLKAGESYLENGLLLQGPKDFSNNNYLNFTQINDLFQNIFFSNDFDEQFKIDIAYKSDFISTLKDYPKDLLNSKYNSVNTPDWFYKFFIDTIAMNTKDKSLKIYNKVGMAGGFISDLSYIVDETHDVRYFLSATLLAKKDDVINNGKNNYYDFGIPFFRKIGSLFYNYEINHRIER